ncbi:hypothetical protein [Catenulispora yoronensis]
MTQQPNQNYPQPGGWGQQQGQQPAQPGWGQQQPAQQQGQQQWGAAQPSYGQAQPAQQYGGSTPSYGGGSSTGGDSWGKVWGFYAAGALAAITAILTFVMPWAAIKIGDNTFNFTALGTVSSQGKSASADGYPKIWGILVIVAAVVAVAGVVLVLLLKKAVMGWVVVGGSGLALIFAVLAGLLGHNKIKDELTSGDTAAIGTHYSLQFFGLGAWIGILATLIGTVLAVLAQLSVTTGGAPASGASASGYQAGYGQQQFGQAGNSPAYGQQGQPGQQQWGGQQAGQAQGQQQWGNPQPPQQQGGQWGGQYDPAANQPTQAVQPGYMPPQQPPQQPR